MQAKDLIQFRLLTGTCEEVEKKVNNFYSSFHKDDLEVRSMEMTCTISPSGVAFITIGITFIDKR